MRTAASPLTPVAMYSDFDHSLPLRWCASLFLCLLLPNTWALESTLTGQLQGQFGYLAAAEGGSGQWQLAMPNNELGIVAVESVSSGSYLGRLNIGIEPLAETSTVVLSPQEAYLAWQQSAFGLWAGRLSTLEQLYLEDPFVGVLAVPDRGLKGAGQYVDSENSAVRLTASSGNAAMFAWQGMVADQPDALPWHAAAMLQTSEGSIAVTYRSEDELALWGTHIRWVAASSQLSAVLFYGDELLAWDLELRSVSAQSQTFLGYGVAGDEAGQWSLGLQQNLSDSVVRFTELLWVSTTDWQWYAGIQLNL